MVDVGRWQVERYTMAKEISEMKKTLVKELR